MSFQYIFLQSIIWYNQFKTNPQFVFLYLFITNQSIYISGGGWGGGYGPYGGGLYGPGHSLNGYGQYGFDSGLTTGGYGYAKKMPTFWF